MPAATPQAAHANGWRAALKRWRRANRRRLNRSLARLVGTATARPAALAADTRRILVVRLNKRLGNILFLTPMLRSLARALPDARIDVLIQEPAQVPLLADLPGVARVRVQQRSTWTTLKLVSELRKQHYDLAIDPTANSAGNRLALALCGARQRMGFAAADQWLRLTHAAPRASSRHQALQSVELLQRSVTGVDFDSVAALEVVCDARAAARANEHWQHAVGTTAQSTVGFFIQATGRKQLHADWWRAWRSALAERAPDARLLQICPPGAATPLFAGTAYVAIAELDVLAALLARLDVFIAADSGPMHLAAAAGAPVMGLFQATRPDAYAPLGRDCATLAGDALTPEAAALAVAERLLRGCRADAS